MKIFVALSLVLSLAACGTTSAEPSAAPSDSTSPTSSYSPLPRSERIPAKCEDTGLLELMNDDYGFKKLTYIQAPEDFVPTPDLLIYPVLANGGDVCAVASNEEQFGMSVYWTEDDGAIFDSQVAGWNSTGYGITQIPGVDSDRQLLLIKVPTEASPNQLISVNFIHNGLWIRVDALWGPAAKFTGTLEAIMPIIEKAMSATS